MIFTKGPLWRTSLLRLNETSHVLLLTLHHVISDEWSIEVLLGEILTYCQSLLTDKPSPLHKLPIQYADFAVWQRNRLHRKVLDSDITFWKERIGGDLHFIELPTDRVRPSVRTLQAAEYSFEFSVTLSEAIQALSLRQGCTLFMTLLAALKTLLYSFTGLNDLVVATPVANRNWPATEDLIGFFVNTLPLRTDLSGNPTFREILKRVRKVTLDAFAHQELHIAVIEQMLGIDLHLPVMFAFENGTRLRSNQISEYMLDVSFIKIKHSIIGRRDLNLVIWEDDRRLSGCAIYSTDLFDRHTITKMLLDFEILLKKIVADPDEHLLVLRNSIL